jgi:hypothetical protein
MNRVVANLQKGYGAMRKMKRGNMIKARLVEYMESNSASNAMARQFLNSIRVTYRHAKQFRLWRKPAVSD